jgi:hypothetical protein
MTRRDFLAIAAASSTVSGNSQALNVPVHRVMDTAAPGYPPELLQRFWGSIWPEAYREFQRAGIHLETSDGSGEVRRRASGRPTLKGLRPGVINLVLTDYIPPFWDDGRALAGVSSVYEGHSFCMLALSNAHGNQVPFLSVNTCVHELLHVLLGDVYISRPKWYQEGGREYRIDWYATRLWLFHEGTAVKEFARANLALLRRLEVHGAQ